MQVPDGTRRQIYGIPLKIRNLCLFGRLIAGEASLFRLFGRQLLGEKLFEIALIYSFPFSKFPVVNVL